MGLPQVALTVLLVLQVIMAAICIKQFADMNMKEQGEYVVRFILYMLYFVATGFCGILLYNS